MLEKKFANKDLGIELSSFIDKQQNIWFVGKDVATLLGYSNTKKAIWKHVDSEDKKLFCWGTQNGSGNKSDLRGKYYTFINESGFYSLLLTSKLETSKKFKHWVTSEVLPSIRKYGFYKMFDNPNNKMFKIENETDLHYKVVQLIRNYYPDSILVAGLGENQDTEEKRLDSYKKGYQRGQPDLMILDYHREYKGLCIEFKSPTNNYCVSESQIKMKEKYRNNDYAFILSNDYDKISKLIHKYMAGVRILCKYCPKAFRNKKTLNKHYKVIHRIEKNI
ncbi:unnamed protein product [Porites evermanni]|uniref:Bro-N domain-containing protein n=1 Tax=Porites evermanni TaxID=104178 RepID=A0ABN8MR42_9CNID|nr:unnamed protein product [Porites evermanni]